MAKLYKVRKKCMICGNIFYPRYAGSLYCEDCKNKKKEVPKKEVKKPVVKHVKKVVKHAKVTKKAVKHVKKVQKKATKKAGKVNKRKR
jgi:hypothetical protein